MRKFAAPVAFVGLLALLVAGVALPQGGGGRDPGASFDRLAKGKAVLSVTEAPPFLQERLAQYAQQHGLGGQLTRDQYIAFVTEMRSGQGAPKGAPAGTPATTSPVPGKGPGAGGRKDWANNPDILKFRADREFRQLDANRDGYLESSEIPAARHDEIFRFDKNGDGLIDPQEYLEYVQARVRNQTGGAQARQQWDVETITPEQDEKPTIYRAGKLPKDLPPWFEHYDLNKDGQVSLYEWRMAREPIDEFLRMDRNDDGLLTAEEVLRYEKLAKAAGTATGSAETAAVGENPQAGAGPRRQGKGPGRKGKKDRQQPAQ